MKRTTRFIIAAEYAVVDWMATHGTLGCEPLGVKLEKIPADHIIRQTAAVDRGHKVYALLGYLQR